MTTFTLNPKADISGTHNIGSIKVVPHRLVERFGPPSECDRYKVSGQYCFEDARGRTYTLYDWKETSLYVDRMRDGEESGLPTPEEFWGNEDPTTLNIGGREGHDVDAFKTWLSGL